MCDDNGILDADICRAFGTYAGKTCGAGAFFGFGQNYSAPKYKNKKHGKYVGFGQKLHIIKKKRLSFLQLRNVLTILLYLTKK